MAAWRSAQQLLDHFQIHGWELGCRTVEEYDASAQRTLDSGRYFEYYDAPSGETRIGCYDRASRLFVVLNTDDEIISHYSCRESHVRGLDHSNYDG